MEALMRMQLELPGVYLIAVTIFAHAWVGRIQAPPFVINTAAWIVVILAVLVLLGSV